MRGSRSGEQVWKGPWGDEIWWAGGLSRAGGPAQALGGRGREKRGEQNSAGLDHTGPGGQKQELGLYPKTGVCTPGLL